MMRSLWTGASGMIAQQTNVDVIGNNLANVNTTGFKRERLEFKSLLYQMMARADLDPVNEMGTRPVNLQVGLGVRTIATSRMFTPGNFEVTDTPLDFAIEGHGFFVVETPNGRAFTKDGNFKIATTGQESWLVTSDGFIILDTNGEEIRIPVDVQIHDVSVDFFGRFFYSRDGEMHELGHQLDIVQFANNQGLEAVGANLFIQTVASGEPMQESIAGDVGTVSRVLQGVREMSNVQIAREMVDLIVAQRAYEINSRVITTSDEMLQTANQLKR
jgi:flagellar basal-body rod protein FlgG